MKNLRALYIMAFTPERMDEHALMVASRSAADALAKKDTAFTRKMGLVEENTGISFSNQLYVSTMHPPKVMQASMGGWMKNENIPFTPHIGEDFFIHNLKDVQGRESYFLFYFEFQ